MIRPILALTGLMGLGVLIAGACTQSYDNFDFSGTTSTAGHGGGTTTTTTTTHTGGTHQGGGGTGGTTTQGGGGTGGTTTQGGSGGTGGQGGACSFGAVNDCGSATDIGQVAGDAGNETQTLDGVGTEWAQSKAAETQQGTHNLSYTVTLSGGGSTTYELYVHEGDANGPNCNAQPVQGSGQSLTISNGWNDQQGDVGRTLSIEVRYISGTDCTPWHLVVRGHT